MQYQKPRVHFPRNMAPPPLSQQHQHNNQRYNALETPEILARVGYFLPLWEPEERKDKWGGTKTRERFRPKTFHVCFLVCKLWYRTFLPILWRLYDYEGMTHVPSKVIGRYSLLFRHFESHGGIDGPFNCTLLETVAFRRFLDHDDDGTRGGKVPNMSLRAQKQLVRRNPGLEMMAWEGSASSDGLSLDPLDVEDFAKLANLQDLRLVRWDGSDGTLVQVLKAIARTLEELEIIDVAGFEERDLVVPSAATKSAGGSGEVEIGGELLVLPCLTTLRVPCDPNNTDMVYLAGCCPNLEELDLEVEADEFDLTRLAYTLKTRCPELQSLTIHDNRDENEPGLSFGTLIRGCCDFSSLSSLGGCGLVKIELSSMAYDAIDRDVIASILAHKATLEDLALDYYCEELQQRAFDAKDVLKILVECRQLRSFTISGSTGLSTPATLKVLRSRPWGCLELEELDMDFDGGGLPWSAPSTSHKPRGGGGGGGKGKSSKKKKSSDTTPANISSTVSYMGWYCHPQESSYLFEEDAVQTPKTTLREAFSMVKELRSLVFLTLNLVTYTRSPDPSVMDYF